MESSLKEKFDKYELLITPVLLILILLLVIIFIPQIAPIDNFFQIFLIPLIIGILSGLFFTYLLDKYWKKVDSKNISKFLQANLRLREQHSISKRNHAVPRLRCGMR